MSGSITEDLPLQESNDEQNDFVQELQRAALALASIYQGEPIVDRKEISEVGEDIFILGSLLRDGYDGALGRVLGDRRLLTKATLEILEQNGYGIDPINGFPYIEKEVLTENGSDRRTMVILESGRSAWGVSISALGNFGSYVSQDLHDAVGGAQHRLADKVDYLATMLQHGNFSIENSCYTAFIRSTSYSYKQASDLAACQPELVEKFLSYAIPREDMRVKISTCEISA